MKNRNNVASSLAHQVAHNASVVQTVMIYDISEKETKFDYPASLSSTGSRVSRERDQDTGAVSFWITKDAEDP